MSTGHGRYLRLVGTTRGTAYGYSLFELEAYGVTDSTGDTQPPTVPTGLASSAVTASSVALSWNASTDNVGVSGYDVLRNGAVVAAATSTSYTDTGLTANTSYSYSVRAKDFAGNTSAAGTAIAVKTSAGGGGDFVLAAAGDIARQCTASTSSCIHPKTVKIVDSIKPVNILTMGDSQYDDAHLSDYQNYYDKTWGKYKSITKPTAGNHDSYDSPAFSGYEKYFGAIVLVGHDHHYERFHPLNAGGAKDPNGVVQIIGGMGGAEPYGLGPARAITAKRLSTYGVLKLNMTDNSWTSTLLGLNNEVLDSSPTTTCKAKG